MPAALMSEKVMSFLHERFEAHCNRGSRSGAVILHIALPGDTDFVSGVGRLADPERR
jgi:hypothetical protein